MLTGNARQVRPARDKRWARLALVGLTCLGLVFSSSAGALAAAARPQLTVAPTTAQGMTESQYLESRLINEAWRLAGLKPPVVVSRSAGRPSQDQDLESRLIAEARGLAAIQAAAMRSGSTHGLTEEQYFESRLIREAWLLAGLNR